MFCVALRKSSYYFCSVLPPFVTEMEYVYCARRSESLSILQDNVSLKGTTACRKCTSTIGLTIILRSIFRFMFAIDPIAEKICS
jgi:hypothetical protein